jgi:peptide/nickel transport system ATP-binding protein
MNASNTPARSDAPLLEVTGLSVDFAVDNYWIPAAKDLSYTVNAGDSLAIVGESGSGKSASSMAMLGPPAFQRPRHRQCQARRP